MASRLGTTRPRKGTLRLASSKPPANPRAAEGDNSKAIEEGERVQLISFVNRLSLAEDAIEAAKVPVKAAQKARSQIVGLAKAAGFSAKELERRLEEMRTPTRVMAATAEREHKHRRWLGILDADQSALILGGKAPEEKKDEAHWAGEGYKAGLRQLSSTPPTECPERFVQAYMKAHERGHLEVLTANAPKPPKPDPAADFAADNPEIDVDAAARKLKKDAAFMDRTVPPETAPEDTVAGDPFEATEEELAAQTGRTAPDADVV